MSDECINEQTEAYFLLSTIKHHSGQHWLDPRNGLACDEEDGHGLASPLWGTLCNNNHLWEGQCFTGDSWEAGDSPAAVTGSLSSHGDHPLPSFLAALLSHFWSLVRGLVSTIFIESQFC